MSKQKPTQQDDRLDFQHRLEMITQHFECHHYTSAYEDLGTALRLAHRSSSFVQEFRDDLNRIRPSQHIIDRIQSDIETQSTKWTLMLSIGEEFQPEEIVLVLHYRLKIRDILHGLQDGFNICLTVDLSELDTKLQRLRNSCKSRQCQKLFHLVYA